MKPKDKSKILKLNKSNIREFRKVYPNRGDEGNYFGGVDATLIRPYKTHYPDELALKDWTCIKIELVGCFETIQF